jgi:hypothetical protein
MSNNEIVEKLEQLQNATKSQWIENNKWTRRKVCYHFLLFIFFSYIKNQQKDFSWWIIRLVIVVVSESKITFMPLSIKQCIGIPWYGVHNSEWWDNWIELL